MFPAPFPKKTPKQQSGFTLIEVMVAMVIFVVAILGCYELQVRSAGSNSRADSVAVAATWAQYIAEDLMARQYESYYTDPLLVNSQGNTANGLVDVDDANIPGDTPDGVRYVGSDGSLNTATTGSDIFTIYWNIVDNRPLDSVKQIRIIVVKNSGLNSGRLYTQDYYKLGPV